MALSSFVDSGRAVIGPRRYPYKEIIKTLDAKVKVGSEFVIHFRRRNREGQPGYGARSVSFAAVIKLYAEELRWTVDFLSSIGLRLQPGAARNVYIFDPAEAEGLAPSPQVITDPLGRGLDERLCIVLPSRTNIPRKSAEEAYLRAAANHECTHIVCSEQPNLGGHLPEDTGWEWFTEGTAEWVALKRSRDLGLAEAQSFDFLADWFAYPEIPITNEDYWYSSVALLDYLERSSKDMGWLATLWREATGLENDDPWGKLVRSFGPALFLEFSCSAYLLNDPRCAFYSPDLEKRFGARAWERHFVGGTDGWIEGDVHDFSCLYFAVKPRPRASKVRVEVQSEGGEVVAALVPCDGAFRKMGQAVRLRSGSATVKVGAKPFDHIAVVITTEPASSLNVRRRRFRLRVA